VQALLVELEQRRHDEAESALAAGKKWAI